VSGRVRTSGSLSRWHLRSQSPLWMCRLHDRGPLGLPERRCCSSLPEWETGIGREELREGPRRWPDCPSAPAICEASGPSMKQVSARSSVDLLGGENANAENMSSVLHTGPARYLPEEPADEWFM
jgi:hypothetical protein